MSFIGDLIVNISEIIPARKLINSSKKEIEELFQLATEMFVGYEESLTASNMFYVANSSDQTEVLSSNDEHMFSFIRINLENLAQLDDSIYSRIDPRSYWWDTNERHDLSKEEVKQTVKKLVIRRNR